MGPSFLASVYRSPSDSKEEKGRKEVTLALRSYTPCAGYSAMEYTPPPVLVTHFSITVWFIFLYLLKAP
jgi:hypothetical protein